MSKTINIIGSGFASLSAACYLAKAGHKVTVFEKNDTVGGRARQFRRDGFTFDIGPTWYWMPDVFERFFADFNKKPSDYYKLTKLAPAYSVYFGVGQFLTISDNLPEIVRLFESIEPGSGKKLQKFISKAKNNYDIAIKDLVYNPGVSPLELLTVKTALKAGSFFSNISRDVKKNFRDQRLIRILEFPVLFLGAKPSSTPSFYSFMNYADFGLGTWHPSEGMYSVVKAMESLATSLGVTIHTSATVSEILVDNQKATAMIVNGNKLSCDILVSGADYHHSETLLEQKYRGYSERFWDKQIFAPSSLLFYVGFNRKVEHVEHHTLFFDVDFDAHAAAIYDQPHWPESPLFYASFPSKTDSSAAPEGMEAATFLIPVAPGIEDTEAIRQHYFQKIIRRLETLTNQPLEDHVLFSKSYCLKDFVADYNSYKGNAYGLANILTQTAFLRPKLKSKKVKNLYFTGQLTVPGPGVPPALISGKLVAELIQKSL